MSAATLGEIVYVCFTMAIGAVAHSIIMGEVINVVTSSDQMNVFVAKQQELIEAFAAHTELDETSEAAMKKWVEMSAKTTFAWEAPGVSAWSLDPSMDSPRALHHRTDVPGLAGSTPMQIRRNVADGWPNSADIA